MAKKNTVAKATGPVTEVDIPKDLIESQKIKYQEVIDRNKAANKSNLPILWEAGKEACEALSDPKNPNNVGRGSVSKLAECIGQSETMVYSTIQMFNSFSKDRVIELAEQGLTLAHMRHLSAVTDKKARTELEHWVTTAGSGDSPASARDLGNRVKEISNENPKVLSESSQKRKRQVATQKKTNSENPIRAVPKAINKTAAYLELASTLTIAFSNVTELEPEESRKVSNKLEELEPLLEALVDTAKALKGECEKARKTCKSIEKEASKSKEK